MKSVPFVLLGLGLHLHAAIPVTVEEFPLVDGVKVVAKDEELSVSWPAADQQDGSMIFDLREGTPLIKALSIKEGVVAGGADPLLTLTVGTRVAPSGRPPGMSRWNVFFDSPHKRPHETFIGGLVKRGVTVSGKGNRTQVRVAELSCGSFKGGWCFTFYAGSPFVLMEA